jgi:release factor glutamine methyltransferase
MRAREAIAAAAARLPGDTPRLDAELLAAHLIGADRGELLLRRLDDPIDAVAYEALLTRRLAREPIAYIVGHREFWSLDFHVTPDVLIPRPDSETLVAAALAAAGPAPRVLDLGTGSGCLLLAVLHERPQGWGLGIDRSSAAVRVARENAAALGLAGRTAFAVADWTAPVAGRFDLVLSNPPYVGIGEALDAEVADFEPASALYAGPDGLEDYRRIIPALPELLTAQGSAHLEIGHVQADLVIEIAATSGLTAELHRDLAGRPRCVSLRPARDFGLGRAERSG